MCITLYTISELDLKSELEKLKTDLRKENSEYALRNDSTGIEGLNLL